MTKWEITMDQLAAAEQWWTSRTVEQRSADWPRPVHGNRDIYFGHWRAWDSESQRGLTLILLEAGLICQPVPMHECNDCGIMIEDHRPICSLCERWYEDRGITPPTPPPTPMPIPERRVPRHIGRIGNGLYIRTGSR